MKEKVIRTNNRCERCDGFLIFEVKESDRDRDGNRLLYGTWICTICDGKESGLWIGKEKTGRKKEVKVL
jgi:RNase P subunit RPR2